MYVVFDLESTGLDVRTADVIQMSYIMFDNNLKFVRAEQMFFFYMGMSWSEDAYKVHGISLEELAKHEDEFEGNLCKMYAILKNNFVVTYNGQHYDGKLAESWLARQGIGGLTFRNHMDMMIEYKPIYKRARMSLVKLCALLDFTPDLITQYMNLWFQGVGSAHAHDSAYDTAATALLLLNAVKIGLVGNGNAKPAQAKAVEYEEVPEADIMAKGNPIDPEGIVVFTPQNVVYIARDDKRFASVPIVYGSILRTCIRERRIIPAVFNSDNILVDEVSGSTFKLYKNCVTFSGGYVDDMPLSGKGIANVLNAVYKDMLDRLNTLANDYDKYEEQLLSAVEQEVRSDGDV